MCNRIFAQLLIITIHLCARENPFVPVISPADGPAIIKQQNVKMFSGDQVQPPEGARILKDVTVQYQNLDGSVTEQKLNVDQHVNWQAPLVINQTPPKVDTNASQNYNATSFLEMLVENSKLFIKTDDEFVRDFFIIQPFRIIVDFKRKVDFESKKFTPKIAPFTEIAVGNHKDFYRVAVTLGTRYAYDVEVYDNGVLIKLK